MQDDQTSARSLIGQKRRLILIVTAHLMIVGSFFAATLLWGNFG